MGLNETLFLCIHSVMDWRAFGLPNYQTLVTEILLEQLKEANVDWSKVYD
jgi:hypothetical protein